MKKFITLFLLVISSLFLVSCHKPSPLNTEVVVIFYTDGGSKIDRYVVEEKGQTIKRPNDPTKLGYVFDNWYKDLAHTELWKFEEEKVEESVTIYAKFDVIHYNINYHISEGENNSQNKQTFTVEDEVFLRPTIKEGYTFNGWYTDSEFKNKIDRIKKGTTEEIDLYSRLAFKVSFDTLYLAVDRVILVDPNEVIPATGTNNNILNPKRSGYNFIGWYNIDTRPYVEKQELPPAEALVDFSNKIIDQEFKVYAYWEKIK